MTYRQKGEGLDVNLAARVYARQLSMETKREASKAWLWAVLAVVSVLLVIFGMPHP